MFEKVMNQINQSHRLFEKSLIASAMIGAVVKWINSVSNKERRLSQSEPCQRKTGNLCIPILPVFSRAVLVLIALIVTTLQSFAVIPWQTTYQNTLQTFPPQGSLLGSGWQYQVKFGNAIGTIIGRRTFITVNHVGGHNGMDVLFEYAGATHTVQAVNSIPHPAGNDLRIWIVNSDFATWAPIYTGTAEYSRQVVVFGRSRVNKGPAVYSTSGVHKGWLQDQNYLPAGPLPMWPPISWAATTVYGYAGNGQSLQFYFYPFFSGDFCITANNDSGGGIFIQDAGVWKLAGITQNSDAGPESFKYKGFANPSHCGQALLTDFTYLYQLNWNEDCALPGNLFPQYGGIPNAMGWKAQRVSTFSAWILANKDATQ
jgi:hypothetical protein